MGGARPLLPERDGGVDPNGSECGAQCREEGDGGQDSRDREKQKDARRLDSGIDPYDVENYLLEVDRPLVVPINTKIRYLVTSNDVIHAWWVPDFAVKKDAVPGFINEGWFKINEPGTYRGQCAELCGKDHGFMPIVVEALPQDEYSAWLVGQTADGAVAKAAGDPAEEHAG